MKQGPIRAIEGRPISVEGLWAGAALPRVGKGRGLHRRLYQALREAILSGRLRNGARLPPTRVLAEELGVARQTVVLVYERLESEGYVTGRVGAGTFVSAALPADREEEPLAPADEAGPAPAPRTARASLPRSAWSARAMAVAQAFGGAAAPQPAGQSGMLHRGQTEGASEDLSRPPSRAGAGRGQRREVVYDFRPGVPDWEAFPHTRWRRLLTRTWRGAGRLPALGHYGDPAGYGPLREALASYLAGSRGLRCTAEQVIIVSGSQQALDLLARVCLNPGDVAAVESPGYPEARSILAAAGASLLPVPVDEAGMKVPRPEFRVPGWWTQDSEPGTRNFERGTPSVARLAYVTPSHQYPTGVTLSLARRLELLAWAAASGALLVEDDYDSELRYAGRPLPALQGLDERGCVAYVGSCSTVLFPPLRVGWIVAPPALIGPLTAAKWLADRQTSTLDQLVLADFISSGEFARHLRRSRRLYGARRAALVAAVQRHLHAGAGQAPARREAITLGGDPAGLQTPLYLPSGVEELAVVRAAAARGVRVYPLGPCYSSYPPRPPAPPPAARERGRESSGDQGHPVGEGESSAARGLLLGFAALHEEAIDGGIRRLAQSLRAVGRGA
jgi:GntR family transcriptional regulator/MocR family aminotransferase